MVNFDFMDDLQDEFTLALADFFLARSLSCLRQPDLLQDADLADRDVALLAR